jgi:PAS domain S-box-containing protein
LVGLERFYIEHRRFRPGTLNAYLLAAALVLLATVLRLALVRALPGLQFTTVVPAVIATALVCGIRAGLFATGLGALSAWFVLIPESVAADFDTALKLNMILLFLQITVTALVFIGIMRAALLGLRRKGRMLESVFEANPDAILLIGADHRIASANARACALFERGKAELAGMRLDALVPAGSRTRHGRYLDRLFRTAPHPARFELEATGLRADGRAFPAAVLIGTVDTGTGVLAIAAVRDLTQQRALAEALAESRRRQAVLEERQRAAEALRPWADAFRHAGFGIGITDPVAGVFRFANPAFAAGMRMPIERAQGMPIMDCYPADDRARVAAMFALADETGSASFEARHQRADGSVYPAHIDIVSVQGEDGGVRYQVASCRDISDSRRTETALRQAQKMEAVGLVAGGMAHDFNNLLQVIIGNLDFLTERLGPGGEARGLAGEALDAALRRADLTRGLLAFSRREAMAPVRLDLNEVASGMCRLLGRLLGPGIEIAMELRPGLWGVMADRSQAEASIANLATNARDAMPEGGRLAVATENLRLDGSEAGLQPPAEAGEFVVLTVTDTGSGMAPEVAARVLEPFFTTKAIGKGTGLGLTMVSGFAVQSGGHIGIDSEPGLGTRVRILLPRHSDTALPAMLQEPADPAMGRGESVMVVEDNAALRRVVVRQLRDAGYNALGADGPAQALSLMRARPVELLFSDIAMPGGMDGYALAEEAGRLWPSMRVVLTSGFAGRAGEAERLGVPLLGKPYRRDDLLRTLRAALDV